MSDAFEIHAPAITTPRLLLRRLSLEDSSAVFAYASDPEVARYTLWPVVKTEESAKELLRLFTRPEFVSWAMVLKGEEAMVGMFFSIH